MQVRCLSHSFRRPYQTRNCDELLSQLLLLLFFFCLLLLLLLLRQCVASLAMAQSGTVSTASPSPSKAGSDSLKCLPWPNAFWNWNVSTCSALRRQCISLSGSQRIKRCTWLWALAKARRLCATNCGRGSCSSCTASASASPAFAASAQFSICQL